ncbi:hypothetical protein HDV04_002443 [Boothiomyces sp. JEL0838]|nr:hypothetical protein HDV04_002443 [Boothiomyces sp. JEL0838]
MVSTIYLKCCCYIGKFQNIDILRSGYYKVSIKIKSTPHSQLSIDHLELINPEYLGEEDTTTLICGEKQSLNTEIFHILYDGQEISFDRMGVFDIHLPVGKLSEKLEISYKLYYGESNPKKLSTIQKKKIQVNTFDTSKYLQFVFDGNEYSFMDVYFTSFISYVNVQQPEINVPQVSYLLGEQLSQIEAIDRYISSKTQTKDTPSKFSLLLSRNSGLFDVKSVQEFREIASNLSPEILLSLQEELHSISSELLPLWCKNTLFDFYTNLLNDRKPYCGEVQTKLIPNVDYSKIFPSLSITQSKQLQLYTANCCYPTLLKPLPGSDVHVIVFVHGFLGCSEDFRQFRNQYLHLLINNGMLDHRIIFYFSKANEKRSYLNLPTMGRRLAEEVDDYLQTSCQAVTKLSFYCHSLGGLIARFALRNKRLCPYQQLFHQFVTYATPHCSLNLHEHFLLKPFMKSSMAVGITYHQPTDPIHFMEDCLKKVKQDNLLTVAPYQKGYLRWDSFLPPKEEHKSTYLLENQKDIYRKLYNPTTIIPPIKPYVKETPNNPLNVKVLNFRTLPDIMLSAPPIRKSKAWTNIVFVIGGPGCGKGTQCEKIAKEYNYLHLSVGDLLRNEAAKHTTTGHEISRLIAEGKIVPMHITLKLLNKAMLLNDMCQGFLIDGFPRQLDQAIEFEETVAKPKFVLYYECGKELLEKRILKRGQTSGRNDDNIETIMKRFRTFEEKTMPVVEYYEKKDLCHKISAEGGIEEIFLETKLYFEVTPLYHQNVVFVLGGPGSGILLLTLGKGTQCEKLAEEFQLVHLSTGDLLREEVSIRSEIGIEAEKLMKEGMMVPKKFLLDILRKKISENMGAVGFLIDGFPRTLDQADDFEKTIGPCRAVLAYDCPLPVLEKRLIERGKTSGRADDNLETIKKRFATFKEQSLPVIQYYKQKGKVVEISSTSEIHEVYEESKKVFLRKYPCKHRNIIFVLGGPGAGKGTQCAFIVNEFKFKHISTGDLLRREIENQTPIGLAVTGYVSKGQNAPMNIIVELLKSEVLNNLDAPGILIDGFPRAMGNILINVLDQALEFERVISSTSTPELIYDKLKNEISLTVPDLPFKDKEIVFVLGGPGSGKGTQCEQIIKNFGYIHISTGDLLREEVNQKTELGKQLEVDMKEGKMISIFESTIANCTFALYFDASRETLIKRLLQRGKTSGRADDNEESIKKRLTVFNNESLPVIHYFSHQEKLKKINSENDPSKVTLETLRLFEELK